MSNHAVGLIKGEFDLIRGYYLTARAAPLQIWRYTFVGECFSVKSVSMDEARTNNARSQEKSKGKGFEHPSFNLKLNGSSDLYYKKGAEGIPMSL